MSQSTEKYRKVVTLAHSDWGLLAVFRENRGNYQEPLQVLITGLLANDYYISLIFVMFRMYHKVFIICNTSEGNEMDSSWPATWKVFHYM